MIKFPSSLAAALTGFFVSPGLILGMQYIENRGGNSAAFLLLALVAFVLPVSISVMDFSYWRQRRNELGSVFVPMVSAQDFKLLYFPVWGRMLVWFIATAASGMLLSYLGLVQ